MALRSALFASLATGAAAGPRDYSLYTFKDFLSEFGRGYNGAEADNREALFNANLATIRAHNEAYARGEQSWWMAVNEFADLSEAEFRSFLGRKGMGRLAGTPSPLRSLAAEELPTSVDWRSKNVLSPVKNQGQCGSCWAFASTASVESAYAIATGEAPPVLAPQAYVSCAPNDDDCGGTGGCEGSIAELAFNYTVTAGLPLESAYPYTATDSKCKSYDAAVKVSGYEQLPTNDANAVATALSTVGPVAVNVAASQWSLYGGGIFNGCTGKTGSDINHVVQAVGYTADYWIVRNSWGPSWGEEGFIYLSRAKDSTTADDMAPGDGYACKPYPDSLPVGGECGVLADVVYPVGAEAAATALEI